MDILLDNCKSKDAVTRRGAVTLLAAFCDQTKVSNFLATILYNNVIMLIGYFRLISASMFHSC